MKTTDKPIGGKINIKLILGSCLGLIFIFVLGLIIFAVFINTNLNISSGSIKVLDAYTTTGFDKTGQPLDKVSNFSDLQSEIYCIVKVSALSPFQSGLNGFIKII